MITTSRQGQRNITDSHTSLITGCVSESEKSRIDQLAEKRGVKRSAIIRDALKLYLTSQVSA